MKRKSRNGMLRPFAALSALVGLAALLIVGYRSLAGRSEVVSDAPGRGKNAPPPLPAQPLPAQLPRMQSAAAPRSKRLLRFGIRHPLVVALAAVAFAVVATMAYLPFSDRPFSAAGIEHPPSDYDQFFTYPQMETITHFAKCDAMLFSTTPEYELENIKERLSIEVEFDSSVGAGASGQAGSFTRRVRSPEEIAEAIRLADEFYESVNCQ